MARLPKVEMFRGDYKEYPVKLPIAKYVVGGKMFLGAKKKDVVNTFNATDSNAVFVVEEDTPTSTDSEYAYFTLILDYNTTYSKDPGTYLAEVQYVANGKPTTYSPQIEFKLLADVVQEIS